MAWKAEDQKFSSWKDYDFLFNHENNNDYNNNQKKIVISLNFIFLLYIKHYASALLTFVMNRVNDLHRGI